MFTGSRVEVTAGVAMWNPVKELKAVPDKPKCCRRNVKWNPVKELKDYIDGIEVLRDIMFVESGEGIESLQSLAFQQIEHSFRGIR